MRVGVFVCVFLCVNEVARTPGFLKISLVDISCYQINVPYLMPALDSLAYLVITYDSILLSKRRRLFQGREMTTRVVTANPTVSPMTDSEPVPSSTRIAQVYQAFESQFSKSMDAEIAKEARWEQKGMKRKIKEKRKRGLHLVSDSVSRLSGAERA